jgi:transposase
MFGEVVGQWCMPNRVRFLEIPESDRAVLERRVGDRGAPARNVQRARIVLLSTQGLIGPQIAERVGCTEPTVVLWRRRFAAEGLAGLEDRVRKPPPRTTVTDEVRDEILTVTLTRPPAELGITHWSSRLLAEWLPQPADRVMRHPGLRAAWVWRSGMPGRIGSIGAVRSRAWTWDFSSTDSTIAFSGGLRYSPTTSRTLASSSGSVENLNVSHRHGWIPNWRP